VFKEISIIVIIIILIVGANFFMENYLDKTSKEITPKLEEVATSLMQKDNVDFEQVKQTISDVEDKWYQLEKIWMLILLHSDLDSVDRTFKNLFASLEIEDSGRAYMYVKELQFLIEYISKKDEFSLKNIF